MSSDVMQEVAELLFGGGGDELIAKMNPTSSDVATRDRKKRKITAGLSAVGAAAGGAGLALGGHNLSRSYKVARGAQRADNMFHAPKAKRRALKTAVGHERLATGLIPLEVAGLTGEIAATKILHGDTKKHGQPASRVKKDITEIPESASFPSKGKLTRATVASASRAAGKGAEYHKKGGFRRLTDKVETHNVKKRDERVEVIWSGEIAKANSEKQQIFGWASVIEVNGEPVIDLQGDRISAEEMEKAGYEYVMKSRKGGDMHLRDNWSPIQKSEMIESFIVTDEKREAMGLPDDVPTGWWVGFQVRDPDVWAKVKSGERTGFSIHGHGRRSPE